MRQGQPDTAPDDGTYTHVDRRGVAHEIPRGIDYGWAHAPGQQWRPFTPPAIDGRLPVRPLTKGSICPGGADFAAGECPGPLPTARPFDRARLLPEGRPDEWYVRRFLQEFGGDIGRETIYHDATGEPLIMSDVLFWDNAKTISAAAPVLKVAKRGREQFLLMLADTIRDPQEIWERVDVHQVTGKLVLRRRYLAWWAIAGIDQPGLAVFEWSRFWWQGLTTFAPADAPQKLADYMAEQRTGNRRWPL